MWWTLSHNDVFKVIVSFPSRDWRKSWYSSVRTSMERHCSDKVLCLPLLFDFQGWRFRVTRCSLRVKCSPKFIANGSWVRRIDFFCLSLLGEGRRFQRSALWEPFPAVSTSKVNWPTQDPSISMRMDSHDARKVSPRRVWLFAKWTVVPWTHSLCVSMWKGEAPKCEDIPRFPATTTISLAE